MKNKKTCYVMIVTALIAYLITMGYAADFLVYASATVTAEKSGTSKQSTTQKVSGDKKCPCVTCKPTGDGTRWGDCYCRIQKRLSLCTNYCRDGKLSYIRTCSWKK